MFFQKKKSTKDAYLRLAEKLGALEQAISTEHSHLESIDQNINKLHSSVNRHDMEIEDLLEEWENKSTGEKLAQEQIDEFRRNEKHFLELFEAYEEQFFNMKRFAASKDEAWAQQLFLMEQSLEHYCRLCGIDKIDVKCQGAKVDYALHEVIEVTAAPSPELDATIAIVYRSGYIYKGNVKRKAQIAAYRYFTTEETL